MTTVRRRASDSVTVDAILASAVAVHGGRLYVHDGGWDVIAARAFPHVQSRIGLALLVHVPYELTGEERALSIRLEGPDAKPMALGHADVAGPNADPDRRELSVTFLPTRMAARSPNVEGVVTLGVNFSAVHFRRPGAHRYVVMLDGRDVRSVFFGLGGADGLLPGAATASE